MGLSCSVLATSRRRGDSSHGDAPAGAKDSAPAFSTGVKGNGVITGNSSDVRLRTAPPSVVIPWVLADIADSLSETDALRRGVTWEQHAARLRVCWQEYGAGFPREFAGALTRFRETGDQVDQVASFLLDIFAGDANEETEKMHVARGSKELWPLVLEEIEKSVVGMQEADWTSAPAVESRQRMRQLIEQMEGTKKPLWKIPRKGMGGTQFANKNAEELLKAIQRLKGRIERVEREVKRVAVEATLKPAPWEVQGPSKTI